MTKITDYNNIAKDFSNYKQNTEDDKDLPTERLGHTMLLNFISNQGPKNILDYGCGSGDLTKEISQYAEYVLWLDISSELLKIAESNNKATNIQYRKIWDINKLKKIVKWKLFDVITLNYVLCTIPLKIDLSNILSQLYGLLKDNWKIYIQNPNRDDSNGKSFKTYTLNKKGNIKSGDLVITTLATNTNNPFDVNDYFYTQWEYTELLQSVGYKNIKIHIIYGDSNKWRQAESTYSPCYIIEAVK